MGLAFVRISAEDIVFRMEVWKHMHQIFQCGWAVAFAFCQYNSRIGLKYPQVICPPACLIDEMDSGDSFPRAAKLLLISSPASVEVSHPESAIEWRKSFRSRSLMPKGVSRSFFLAASLIPPWPCVTMLL